MFVPIALLLFSTLFLISNVLTKGSFIERSTELKGGKLITVEVRELGDLSNIPYDYHITRGITTNVLIEIPLEENETEVIRDLGNYVEIVGRPTVTTVGPVIGDLFWQQAQLAMILAFAAMATVVFILFRSLVPSSIVMLAAATDIITTVAIIDILGIKLSLPVLAALLMIIGYSVDSDIMLTTNLLKTQSEDVEKNIRRAFRTGIMMSATALIAFTILFLVSGSFVLQQMSAVLIVGLLIDLPATWLTNVGLLRLWMERRKE